MSLIDFNKVLDCIDAELTDEDNPYNDGLCRAIQIIGKQQIVKAIPIEWIKNYASHKASEDFMDCYWHFWEDDVLEMVRDWEKENER